MKQLGLLVLVACGGDGLDLGDAKPVVANYVTYVHANYSDIVMTAQTLQTAVDTFVADPSEATLTAAREAWLAAREPYGLSESYRFYDGPIDNADTGPEGRINSWPLDEVFIDYVEGAPDAGIINDLVAFPVITKDVIAMQNERGGEKNISSGYHAIEFLLWGQDDSATGPGDRPHTDYIVGGTATNPERRGQYLTLTTALLVEDLTSVRDQWIAGTAYAKQFVEIEPREAVRRMLQGMGALSGAELSGERLTTAIDNRDQEDEHSCFSDNTHRDLLANATAIANVYYGRYGAIDGAGLDELVRARDPELAAKLEAQLAVSIAAIEAIPVPFDQAILSASGRDQALTAVRALQDEAETIVEVASLLDIQINLE